MAKQSDRLAGGFEAEQAGTLLSGLLAEENEFDRRALLRIGTWGVVAVSAVTLALMSNQWSLGLRRDQISAADLTRQVQQIQAIARESQNQTRRLASAVETLNSDRDRLFSRVTVLEEGLDSVTGALAKQAKPAPAPSPAPQVATAPQPASSPASAPATTAQPLVAGSLPPVPAPVATAAAADKPGKPEAIANGSGGASAANGLPAAPTTPPLTPAAPVPPSAAASLVAKANIAPPEPAAPKAIEPAKPAEAKASDTKGSDAKSAEAKATETPPAAAPAPAASPETTASASEKLKDEPDAVPAPANVQRTDFAVDLGGANSLPGLRALWRGVRHNADLSALSPIIVVREGLNGIGMQLRLAAGPLKDAAAAAKICAALAERKRACEPTIYDGQRLAMKEDEARSLPAIKPLSEIDAKPAPQARPNVYKHPRHARKEEPPPPPPPPPPPEPKSAFSSLFGRK